MPASQSPPRLVFINLPVADLARATAFYEALGARRDERFCDGTAHCMVVSEHIHVMLLTHAKFAGFTPKSIADSRRSTEVLLCLSADSREEVDGLVAAGEKAGGIADPAASQDHGFMYLRTLEDPDGHIWEFCWMDLAAFEAARAATA